MSSCSATGSNTSAANRVFSWNVVFLDSDDSEFAGVYQQDGFLTFADVFRELRLCFDFPGRGSLSIWPDDDNDTDLLPSPVHEDSVADVALAHEVPTDASGARIQLRLALHARQDCAVPTSPALEHHLQSQCARRVQPKKRLKRPYLAINERARDLPLGLPFRNNGRNNGSRSGSQSPRKRPRSGSQSPAKTTLELDDIPEAPATVGLDGFDSPELRLLMQQFRATACSRNDRCAITGLGRAWTRAGGLGPGVQACHIVPQLQYNLYPDRWLPLSGVESEEFDVHEGASASPVASRDRLEKAWKNAWAGGNSLLLLRHLHDLFDARFFSIHPETKRIRIFVPYDVLKPYHGLPAYLDSRGIPDKRALGQHWDICCIENMIAASPSVQSLSTLPTPSLSPGGVVQPSGRTALGSGNHATNSLAPREPTKINTTPGGGDGPSPGDGQKKHQRESETSRPGLDGAHVDCQTPHLTHSFGSEDGDDLGSDHHQRTDEEALGRPAKRPYLSSNGDSNKDERGEPQRYLPGGLAKEEGEFLADVEWALEQWKAAGTGSST
ncbi:hypothetical protein B0T25DRAFT_133143 [Lasiosphaeria hispida]|uniref:HNH nuclease domain-containing protein n=1 Tax=Lasiosphaeria hispida TaxID=260671 RepID=A0AAJ0MIW2_9PEZI|nr:hypothetical protein B0T25DRAFT_133143 [Lasiosphaeria hispida]